MKSMIFNLIIMKKNILYFFGFCLLWFSCKTKERLTQKDLSFLPYYGDEQLVYFSDKGDSDTIKLSGYKTLYYRNKNHENNGEKYYQVERILIRNLPKNKSCERADVAPPACFFIVLAKIKDSLFLQVLFNNRFRGVFEVNLNKAVNEQSETIVKGKKYNDILVFKKYEDVESKGFEEIKQIIWSQSAGLVGYQTKSGIGYYIK